MNEPFIDNPGGMEEWGKYDTIKKEIINTLSENQFTISQTRYLFNDIVEQFERNMPVTNHKREL